MRIKIFILICSALLITLITYYYLIEIKNPDITGYVTDKRDNEVLIVSSERETSEGGEFYDACWVKIPSQNRIIRNPQIGQKVQAKFGYAIVERSHPGRARAKKLFVIPRGKYPGASLSEDEVIKTALDVLNIHRLRVIENIEFNNNNLQWSVTLINLRVLEEDDSQTDIVFIDDISKEVIKVIKK